MVQNYMLFWEEIDMDKIAILGAGGAAGRNFKKAVDLGYERINKNVRWQLIDSDPLALELCSLDERNGNEYEYHAISDFDEVLGAVNFDVIHSQPEQGVEFLIHNKKKLGSRVFHNSLEEYDIYRDKLTCQTIWRSCLDIPFWIKKTADINKKTFNRKIVNQPNGKLWVRARTGAGSRAALPVSSYKQLQGWESFWKDKDPGVELIISDMLPGDEFAVQMLWINGKLIAAQARQRVDYLFGKQMPSGQSSTPAVSKICTDQEVYYTALFALKFLTPTPHGVYGVDMKRTHCGRIMPTEINYGRFYTTSHQWAEYTPNPLNIPFDYIQWILRGTVPSKRVNSLPDDIVHVRGLDSNGVLLWPR